MKGINTYLCFFGLLLIQSCEYEVLHELVEVNFEIETECYWATFTTDENLEGDYFWEFGDGDTSNLRNPRHIYDLAGQYEVTLTVVNGEGAGSFSNDIVVNQPSANTFRRDDIRESEFYGGFISSKYFSDGYHILSLNSATWLTDVYDYSINGEFQEIREEGSEGFDNVAYYRSQGRKILVKNLNEGRVYCEHSYAVTNIDFHLLFEEEKFFSSDKVVLDESDGTTFVLGTYGGSEESKEGFFVWNLDSTIYIPFGQYDIYQVFSDIDLTPNGDAFLVYNIGDQDIRVMKIGKDGNLIWDKSLIHIDFFRKETQSAIQIVALNEEDFIVSIADSDGYLSFGSNPEPKTHIIKARKEGIIWEKILNKVAALNAISIAQNEDIILCGSIADDIRVFTSTYMVRMKSTGEILFAKELYVEDNDIFPEEIIETPKGEFFIVGRKLQFLQVDCGGNL